MRDTSSIGNSTEAMVLAALVRAGYKPLIPFGGGHPYDIALDMGGKLARVQCKTGRLLTESAVFFPTAIWCRNMSYRSYQGDVDLFGVFCRATEQVYLVPIEDVPAKGAYLRIAPTKNGQTKGVRWAKDYVIWPRPTEENSTRPLASVTALAPSALAAMPVPV
ncbi:MAG TPA: group I intron-associated PD-(D/E)XK endonuclease [Streptosporangiaceae bacterium]|nr:group I intron-associated PD-(D/E)XK endonuclease [Streptosporangiaceae bacterium]